MGLIKKFLQFVNLGETLSRFLTLGIGNGLYIFFYNVIDPLSLFDFIVIKKIRVFLLPTILIISTLFFFKILSKKNRQENHLIKFNFFPYHFLSFY